MKTLSAMLLACLTTTALAATEKEIRAAFEKAQKKGAVAVMEERCGGQTTVSFPGATAEGIAKTAAALAALAAVKPNNPEPAPHCSGGLHENEVRTLDLYPDGTVKPH